jgi:asparagine synthase (glutamine-hydrolysing)
MSIILGLLKERGDSVIKSELQRFSVATKQYATGPDTAYACGRLGLVLQPYASHARSRMDDRPFIDRHGNAIAFDGRLDNYEELADILGVETSIASDSEIVLEAFQYWGEDCFCRLTGDWALALWAEKEQALFLARDHAGTRTLYFRHQRSQTMWSTHLDTFLTARSDLRLSQDYVACYLACRPIRDLTPWEGVRSIRPAHYLAIRDGLVSQHAHWNPLVTSTIRYKTDSQYEEHFLHLFCQAVARRTGPGAPILAQLSGGMDSTSIVCMSDSLRRRGNPEAEILDTVSFYDDSEASLNERPYFSIVEAGRGKTGTHINTAFSQRTFDPHDDPSYGAYLTPGADSFSICQERHFYDLVWHRGYRSILSGIGGDEVLGGVPNPLPELADHLVTGRAGTLLRQSVAWSLVDRTPLLKTLYDTARYTVQLYEGVPSKTKIPPWVATQLRKRAQEIDLENTAYFTTMMMTPHRVDNGMAWWSIMETLPHLRPQLILRPEYRYPLLDKDLVNYVFAIPREQVLRPGRRRSLMRRALRGIVPFEILERRRKAFQLRAPLSTMQKANSKLEHLFADSATAKAGFVDMHALRLSLEATARGDAEWRQPLLKTIALELWLRATPCEDGSISPRTGRCYAPSKLDRPPTVSKLRVG